MRIDCFSDATAFDRLEGEWDDLLHQSVTDSIFLTLNFQRTWWRHLGGGELCIITVRDESGTLVGIMPLYAESPRNLSLIGCVDVSDYLDIIVIKNREADVYAALLDVLLGPAFPKWDRIQFCTLPSSSPTNTLFKQLAEDHGLKTTWQRHDVSPVIELPATWDEYLERIDKKQRHEIRRKLRRTEEAGGQWRAVQSGQELDRAVMDFIELHKKSLPDKHLFMHERMQQFFTELAPALARHGQVQLEFLEIGGERAAGIFNFIYNNRVLVYNSGYDPAKYGALSPGMSLFSMSIREAIAARRSAFDFLRGAEEYKYRFGASNSDVYELLIEHR